MILLTAIFLATADIIYDFSPWVLLAYAILLLISIKLKNTDQIHSLLLIFLFKLFVVLNLTNLPTLIFWLPLISSVILLLPFSATRKTIFSWAKIGVTDKVTWILVGLTIPLSAAFLITWAYFSNYLGVGKDMIRPFLGVSPWVLFGLIGPGFALLNACAEEFFFRGVIQESLHSVLKNNYSVIIIQAIFFAAAHFNVGFPNGFIGFLMVFSWGAVIGYMRQRTGGLLAPVITHVAADMIIFTVLGVLASTNV